MKSVFIFVTGFASGWAVRSIADSPEGVGVKLIEVAHKIKDRVEQWAAVEYERLADMYAQARSSSNVYADGNAKGKIRRVEKQEMN
jgi:hypothetical protein